MIDPDRRLGPWRIRAWGLVVNLLGNALSLVGMVRFVEEGTWGMMATGVLVTALCLGVLAVPAKPPQAQASTEDVR